MTNPFASETELIILNILDNKAAVYGMEIIRLSKGKLKRGTTYVALGRLKDRGLIQSTVAKNRYHNGMSRPLYTLTQDGYTMLEAWKIITNTI